MFYVYIHKRPDGTPFYVGKGKGRRAYRFDRQNAWYRNVVAKYGKKNIIIDVYPCDSETQAFQRERDAIAYLRNAGVVLVNQTDGGEGTAGNVMSPETKRKIAATKIGKPLSTTTRANMSATRKGRTLTPEHKAKIGAANKGKRRTPEHLAVFSAVQLGKKASLETRAKMSAARKGKPRSPEAVAKTAAGLRGKSRPPEVRAKISASLRAKANHS